MLGHDRMLDSTGRLARSIAWMLNPILFPGVGNQLEINQEELGQLSGISRQATNRGLRVLQDSGLLTVEGSIITVHDVDELSHYGE